MGDEILMWGQPRSAVLRAQPGAESQLCFERARFKPRRKARKINGKLAVEVQPRTQTPNPPLA